MMSLYLLRLLGDLSLSISGNRNTNGSFNNLSSNANFWSSTPSDSANAWRRNLNSSYSSINRNSNSRANGFSLRCL